MRILSFPIKRGRVICASCTSSFVSNYKGRVHRFDPLQNSVNMVLKIFNVRNFKAFPRQHHLFSGAVTAEEEDDERLSSPLRIVHPGGIVESYYMAVPAVTIIEMYPSFLLTRPEVFGRPWDSIIRPDEMLALGQKYFLVPRRTVKKLWRRSPRPSDNQVLSINSFLSNCSISVSVARKPHNDSQSSDFSEVNRSSFGVACIRTVSEGMKPKNPAGKKHVRFAGVVQTKENHSSSKMAKEKTMDIHGKKRKVKTLLTWQPSLKAIGENQCN